MSVANKMCTKTWEARNDFSNKLDDALGVIHDLKNRLYRLNTGAENPSDKKVRIKVSENEGEVFYSHTKPSDYDAKCSGKACKTLQLHQAPWDISRCEVGVPEFR